MKEIIQMGVKLFEASRKPDTSMKFSAEESNQIFVDKLIKESVEYAGLTYTAGMKMDYDLYSHPVVKKKLFQLIGATIDAIVPKFLSDQYDRFVDVRNIAWGDKLIIEVTSPDIFTVSKVANGTINARRQRLDRRSLPLAPTMKIVKVYEELYRLLSGRMDWATYVNRVAMSFVTAIQTDVYTALYNSYNGSDANYFFSGTFAGVTFNTICERVKAANGGVPVVAFGTKLALSKISAATGFTAYPGLMSQSMLDDVNKMGYLGQFQGTDLIQIDQALTPGTDNFAIDDSWVFITPMGRDKIVKLGFEGDTIVSETNALENQDESVEFVMKKMWDCQILAAGKYGILRLS